jgi:S-formylglutathione hydrolase FrmB
VWTDVTISGHSCGVYTPAKPSPDGFTVLYLHDQHQSQLADHPAFARQFDEHGLRCIAPVTGRSWWTNRILPSFDAHISAERHVLDRVLPWLADAWHVKPPQIALLGTSMGGQGVLRLSYKHPNVFPVVAAISPAIDYQWVMEQEGDESLRQLYSDPEQARQDTATLHIHPLNWPRHQWFACDPTDYRWHDSADKLRMKLYSLGVPYESDLETSGGGHTWEYYERMAEPAVEFIVERLERERLRA